MEELQSTEALDREILEDARRKAQRLLKTADEAAAAQTASWEKKTEEALAKLRETYEHRAGEGREEIMARLPMDKRRSRLEKIDGLLQNAAVSYLENLPQEKTLSLLGSALAKRADEFQEPAGSPEPLAVSFRGLGEEELRSVFEKALPGAAWTVQEPVLQDAPGSFPAIRIEAPSFRATVSVESEVEALLLDKRAELTGALIGAEALAGEQYA